MASEASQENFEKIVFLTTKYVQIVKLEHLLCPKVGGGGHKPTCAPHFWKWGGTCPPAPLLLRPCNITYYTIKIKTQNCFRRKSHRRYGDITKQYEVPLSRMLHDILEDDHIQWHPPLMRHYTNFLPFTDLDLISEFDILPNCVRFP